MQQKFLQNVVSCTGLFEHAQSYKVRVTQILRNKERIVFVVIRVGARFSWTFQKDVFEQSIPRSYVINSYEVVNMCNVCREYRVPFETEI